jgi:indolepyruvate ferredoxin oxidoreductase beta subunit
MNKQDVLMVGVGGQGIVLASDILGEVALTAGHDVKKTDTLGMAQRGGSVVSHVRIAKQVYSPLIKEGEADMLVAFEKLEAARWGYFLRPGGLAIVNNHAMPPLAVSLGTGRYPSDEEVKDILKRRTDRVCLINGTSKAKELGDIRTLNMFMLGCMSSFLPIDVKVWQDCITKGLLEKILKINIAAFELGRKEAASVNL